MFILLYIISKFCGSPLVKWTQSDYRLLTAHFPPCPLASSPIPSPPPPRCFPWLTLKWQALLRTGGDLWDTRDILKVIMTTIMIWPQSRPWWFPPREVGVHCISVWGLSIGKLSPWVAGHAPRLHLGCHIGECSEAPSAQRGRTTSRLPLIDAVPFAAAL